MTVYCVSYDLNKLGQRYAKVYEELKKSPKWIHLLDSTWLIATSESAQQLSDRILKHTDENDRFLVIKVTREYQGYLSQDQWDWINQNVTY